MRATAVVVKLRLSHPAVFLALLDERERVPGVPNLYLHAPRYVHVVSSVLSQLFRLRRLYLSTLNLNVLEKVKHVIIVYLEVGDKNRVCVVFIQPRDKRLVCHAFHRGPRLVRVFFQSSFQLFSSETTKKEINVD